MSSSRTASSAPGRDATGATPRLSAVRLSSSEARVPPISLTEDLGAAYLHSPTIGKSPRPPDEVASSSAAAGTPKVAKLDAGGDAATTSRDISRLSSLDDESQSSVAAALLATGNNEDEDNRLGMAGSEAASSDEEDEDASLARMLRMRKTNKHITALHTVPALHLPV